MSSNQAMIDAWNGVLFDKYLQFKHLLIDGPAAHSEALLSRDLFRPGERVLDVGCGFGDCTKRIATLLGENGMAMGVDCSGKFIHACKDEHLQSATKTLRFLEADVQTHTFDDRFDGAFARFGTMFFIDPIAAMRNIRCALKPGAEFHQIVWRRKIDNPWLFEAEKSVAAELNIEYSSDPEPALHKPGPFSMSCTDTVSHRLLKAGFTNIRFERSDADICIGRDLDEAVNFATTLGPAGELIRLAGEQGHNNIDGAKVALREKLAIFQRKDGVWAPSSTWFISASNPA